jgi:hypothetical protein
MCQNLNFPKHDRGLSEQNLDLPGLLTVSFAIALADL